MELSITHMQIWHNVVRRFIFESMGAAMASNIELEILEFFPMFL